MLLVIGFRFRLNQNIINEDDHEFVEIGSTNPIHQIHKHCGSIGQSKRHNHEFIVTIACAKSCLGNIFIVDSKLMITRTEINLREVGCSLKLIEEIVNPRKWITSLDGEFVEFTVVNTHSKRTILLFNEQDRGSPWRRTRANEPFIRKFL